MDEDVADDVSKWEALIQYHLKVDPDTLDDDKFSLYAARLKYALKKTGQWQ